MGRKLGFVLCAVLLVAATARAQNPHNEEKAIRALAAHWQQDWNRDDVKALAGLLSVDADYVTDNGTWLRGRSEFENWRTHLQPAIFQHSTWSNNQMSFRFLQPDIAVLHLAWTIRAGPPGMGVPAPSRSGISTWILVKVRHGWQIRAAQDTEIRQSPH